MIFMIKVLFQGDSITDAGRDRSDIHNLGNGYPFYAANYIRAVLPDEKFEFINLGISGDQTADLVRRLDDDFIKINPDIVSIHIGINDTWHRAPTKEWLSNEVFESNYRTVLEAIKTKTAAKILMIEQYLLPVEDKLFFREDLNPKIDITRKLAREYADAFIPLDGLLAKGCVSHPLSFFSDDGVHPNASGSDYIGKIYADAFAELFF